MRNNSRNILQRFSEGQPFRIAFRGPKFNSSGKCTERLPLPARWIQFSTPSAKWILGPWTPIKKTIWYRWSMESFLLLFSSFGILWEKRLQNRNIPQEYVQWGSMQCWTGRVQRSELARRPRKLEGQTWKSAQTMLPPGPPSAQEQNQSCRWANEFCRLKRTTNLQHM